MILNLLNYFISGQNDCNYPPTPYSTQSSRAERNSNEPSPSPEDIQSSSLPKDNAPNADYGALVDKISQLQVFLNYFSSQLETVLEKIEGNFIYLAQFPFYFIVLLYVIFFPFFFQITSKNELMSRLSL